MLTDLARALKAFWTEAASTPLVILKKIAMIEIEYKTYFSSIYCLKMLYCELLVLSYVPE